MELVLSAFVPRLFPTLNEILEVRSKDKKHGWSDVKKMCEAAVKRVFKTCEMLPEKPYHVRFVWLEWNMRRDPDNVGSGGCKPILDALQEAGLISDDGWGYLGRIVHDYEIAPTEQDVGVRIEFYEDRELIESRRKMAVPKGRAAHPPAAVRIVKPRKIKGKARRGKRRLRWKKQG